MSSDGVGHSEPVARLVEHFFRHEAGRLIAVLARVFGLRHLDLVEDMVQSALLEALGAWRLHGVPDDPSAWMHRVARNKVLDALRRRETLLRIAPAWARLRPQQTEPAFDDLFLDSQIEDSQLRMMFACCHPALAREDQLALTLKSLGGFSNAEIARGLLASEEAIKKRIQRARRQLIEEAVELSVPSADELSGRLDAVHQCLYLLFNEGYAATAGDAAVRVELCEEAVRLCQLLANHPAGRTPPTLGLLALMLFHAARFETRTDTEGRLLLLEDQDRSKWDRGLIDRARWFLDQSAFGRAVSPFQLEAGIALLHCSAPSFADTDWSSICRLYDLLVTLRPSPVYALNRAVALAHRDGPRAGIAILEALADDPTLRHYPLREACLGELYRRAGDIALALEHFRQARAATSSPFERELLDRRIASCDPPSLPMEKPS